jgi:ABC-type uncharacterized transport system substrate-binding protein
VDRRHFLLASLAGVLALPLMAEAQRAERVYQVGILTLGAESPGPTTWWQPLIEELHALNYDQGRNLAIKYAGAGTKPDRLSGLARDIVNARVDVIVTTGPRETRAAKAATSTIPIVMTLVPDPVGAGLVADLAHPGGNVTGLATVVPGLHQKYVEFLHELVPSAKRFALVVQLDPGPQIRQEIEESGRVLGVTLVNLHVNGPSDFEPAFIRARKEDASGVIVTPDVLTQIHRQLFVQLALMHRLPAIYWARAYVEAGGLMSYSADLLELRRRAAHYVDRLLRGTKPADLPVERPTKFELVINLKTAKALGLTIPPSLLARADQIIE